MIISLYISLLLFVESTLCVIFPGSHDFQFTNSSVLIKFVSHYSDYFFVIHHDDSTVINIEKIIKILPTFKLVNSEHNIPSLISWNTVNIFFIHNSSNIISFRQRLKVFNQDGCNLFITQEVFQEICLLEDVKLASASFIFNVNGKELVSCFAENEDLSLTTIGEDQLDLLHLFHKTYKDLRGISLKLYFLHNPTIICKKVIANGRLALVESGTCNPVGPEADLVRVLGKTLNFVPEFWVFQHSNGKIIWKEMINAISRGEVEFGAGSIYISDDGPVYYTSFICSSALYGIFYVNPTKQFNLEMILKTFDEIVYFCSLSTLILILIITLAFTYFFNRRFERSQYIFTLIKIVVEQGSKLNSHFYNFITMRLILSLWLFFNIIFSTALKSKISSALIIPQAYDFKSVEDLSQNDFIFTIAERFHEMFYEKYGSNNIRSIDMDIRNYENPKETCPDTKYLFQLRYAFVHSEFSVVIMNKCKKYFPMEKVKDQRYLMEGRIYQALAMNPASPHKKQFTTIINRLKAAGIMSSWYKHLNIEHLRDYNKELAPPKPLEMNQIYSFFVVLTAGLGIGFIVFILEILEAASKEKWNKHSSILNKI